MTTDPTDSPVHHDAHDAHDAAAAPDEPAAQSPLTDPCPPYDELALDVVRKTGALGVVLFVVDGVHGSDGTYTARHAEPAEASAFLRMVSQMLVETSQMMLKDAEYIEAEGALPEGKLVGVEIDAAAAHDDHAHDHDPEPPQP